MAAGSGWCPRLFVIEIRKTMWSKDAAFGRVSNVHLKDIDVTAHTMPESMLKGFDADHGVSDITVEQLSINGRRISDAESGAICLQCIRPRPVIYPVNHTIAAPGALNSA